MKNDLPSSLLYMALGAGLIFAVRALFGFIEPEGSNLKPVSLFIGLLVGLALGIILDRTFKKRE